MPRLLPKLVQHIRSTPTGSKSRYIHPSRRTRRSVPIALPYPSFSPHGRKQSILLDDVNPILHSDAFKHSKLDAPVIPLAAGRGKHSHSSQVREMTDRECEWWSNPYRKMLYVATMTGIHPDQVRMLSSPLRQCMITEKQLPANFMIRLAPLRVSDPRDSRLIEALLPDGVEHSRFRRHNSGRGYYVTCRKESINELVSRSAYKRIPAQSKLHVHSLLATQVGHQLRLKVLQELELLAESLRCAPQGSRENIVLRRLTRTEWAEIKTVGRISQSGAVAVLVVPPINQQTLDESQNTLSSPTLPILPPLSVLYEAQVPTNTSSLPTRQVPLYNGLSLLPSASCRSKLYKALQKALLIERQARWRQNSPSGRSNSLPNDHNDKPSREKSSHAYLLRSDGNTIRRADSAPLAIALWRIRMWEGQGWKADLGSYGGWGADKK